MVSQVRGYKGTVLLELYLRTYAQRDSSTLEQDLVEAILDFDLMLQWVMSYRDLRDGEYVLHVKGMRIIGGQREHSGRIL